MLTMLVATIRACMATVMLTVRLTVMVTMVELMLVMIMMMSRALVLRMMILMRVKVDGEDGETELDAATVCALAMGCEAFAAMVAIGQVTTKACSAPALVNVIAELGAGKSLSFKTC